LTHLRPGLRLLDVGCRPGTITADFARRLAPGTVRGIDTSTEVIAGARRDHPDVAFATGDVYRLDFEDASWHIVHAHQVLQHLSDPGERRDRIAEGAPAASWSSQFSRKSCEPFLYFLF
jgi:trans-aconitate methyltransferase